MQMPLQDNHFERWMLVDRLDKPAGLIQFEILSEGFKIYCNTAYKLDVLLYLFHFSFHFNLFINRTRIS